MAEEERKAPGDIKQFLYAWLGSKKYGQPEYNIRPTGPKHRQRFLCELRVTGFDYIGAGNSTSKKDAQANAAKDFCNFLVRSGEMQQSDIPGHSGQSPGTGHVTPGVVMGLSTSVKMFTDGAGPGTLGPAYQKHGHAPGQGDFNRDFIDNKKTVEDAEDADPNAGIHGNWTMENGKSMLHQFLQTRNIHQADYVYSMVGTSFVAEMSFYVRELGRNVVGRGQASTKHIASKTCALSITRQLFHLGVIQAYSGTLSTRKPGQSMMTSHKVAMSPDLSNQVEECLKSLDLAPVDVSQYQGLLQLKISLKVN